MNITLKLYATLGDLLPPHARSNAAEIAVDPQTTPNEIIQRYRIPPALAHLVLINGVFVGAGERDTAILNPGDVLAIWPPVAGG